VKVLNSEEFSKVISFGETNKLILLELHFPLNCTATFKILFWNMQPYSRVFIHSTLILCLNMQEYFIQKQIFTVIFIKLLKRIAVKHTPTQP